MGSTLDFNLKKNNNEDKTIEIIHCEEHKEKRVKKNE